MHEHWTERREKRVCAIEELDLAHGSYPLGDLVLSVPRDLIELLLILLRLCSTTNLLSCEGSGVRDIMPRLPG